MRRRLIIALGLISASAALAEAPAGAPSAKKKPAAAPQKKVVEKAPGEAKIGDLTTCLVTDERFTVAADSGHAEYKGKTYYFCCDGCAEDFQKDPEKFVAQAKHKH